MNKRITENVIAVIVGVCWIALLWKGVSLFADALMLGDTKELEGIGDYKKMFDFIKWTSIAVVLLLVPSFVCGAFKIFTKNKIFSVICSSLLFAALACTIGFYCKIDAMAEASEDILQNIMALGYFGDAIIVMVATAVLCAYYAYESVLAFIAGRKKGVEKAADKDDAPTEEVHGGEV